MENEILERVSLAAAWAKTLAIAWSAARSERGAALVMAGFCGTTAVG